MAEKKKETAETPHRCECHRLLFTDNMANGQKLTRADISDEGIITVKCPRCGTMNTFKVHLSGEQNFQDKFYLLRANRNTKYSRPVT